jgi:exodeoxyribonuclease VII large subunit
MNRPNPPEYSVSELSAALKRTIEDAFGLIRVRGEISGFKRAASGHIYLCLKDMDALIDGVMWKSQASRLRFKPEDGLEVICTARLTTYPGRSKYQLVIEAMEIAGVGALMALLEERKKKFAAEGLFAPERKRALPYLPETIGVVTSPTGAVIRDILHRVADRFPRNVLLWPVLVQGEGAAEQIAAAIEGFNRLERKRPDVLIVARGGGSIEDLWAFNEEIVIRAVAASRIPVISAVGHETDMTLIDFVSDRRAPTPTAAAEFAVPVRAELIQRLGDLDQRLIQLSLRGIEERRHRLGAAARLMPRAERLLDAPRQKLDIAAEKLPRALLALVRQDDARLARLSGRLQPQLIVNRIVDGGRRAQDCAKRLSPALQRKFDHLGDRLGGLIRVLESLSYHSVLERGYALVRGPDDRPIAGARGLTAGLGVTIEMKDGKRSAIIGGARASKPRQEDEAQPRLLD